MANFIFWTRNRRQGTLSAALVLIPAWLGFLSSGCFSGSSPQIAEAGKPILGKPASPQVVTLEADFQPLTLDSFVEFESNDETWSEESGVIICSGVPHGYLYSKEKYRNFTLRGEYQFVLTAEQLKKPERANTGFLLAIQEPHKVWPVSLEVQGQFGTVGSIRPNGGYPALATVDHPEVRERIRKPIDQWNEIEIEFRDGTITSRLNGEVVCTSATTDLKEGLIGLQSEGYVVRFRNLRIRPEK